VLRAAGREVCGSFSASDEMMKKCREIERNPQI
jgi:hypothetical protein